MVAITERAEWAEQIRQIEVNDPVQGGENGIDNIPHQQLANRTAYLKKQFDDLKKNHLSNNDLENSLDSDDSNKALTANQGKILKELIDSKSSQDDFTQSFAQNGYCKLPNGLVLQWGSLNYDEPPEGYIVINFPIPFPNNCLNATATRVMAYSNKNFIPKLATIPGILPQVEEEPEYGAGDGTVNIVSYTKTELLISLQDLFVPHAEYRKLLRGCTWFAIGF